MNKIDTWKEHKEADPNENFQMTKTCELCKEKFISTLEKNVKKEEILIELNKEKKRSGGFFSAEKVSEKITYEIVTKYFFKCPNCGYSKNEMFCAPFKPKKIVIKEKPLYWLD